MGQTFPTMAELSARMQAEAAKLPNQPVKLPDGWTFVPPLGPMGFAVLVHAISGKNFRASPDPRLWEKQILDFEFKDGAIERSGRPWPQAAAEIPVTDEMITAAKVVRVADLDGSMTYYEAVYRAMHVVAPVPLVSEAEDLVVVLTKERDEAFKHHDAFVLEANNLLTARNDEIALLRQALAMKDARIGELKSVLASTPVAFEDPDAKPEPEINPFRNFGHDPRRMGPF